MEIDLLRRKIGLNFDPMGYAEVLLWAPYALGVNLEVNNAQKDFVMIKQDRGYWFLRTNKIKPGDEYLFKIKRIAEKEYSIEGDIHLRRADPASVYQAGGVNGYSTAFDLTDFSWEDEHWQSPVLQDYIIYELHVGTFTAEGDFAAIEGKLDHLIDLGITAIEIMPVAQFPGKRNWGYDVAYPFAVQNSYGGPNALRHLVNACHKRGIAIILDVVYNHLGPEGNYLDDFGPYFTDKYGTPWGNAINFDDAQSDEVRFFYIENVLMWFRDFHIDALRLDAVHAIKDFGATHILAEIKKNVELLSNTTGKEYQLIVELDLNDHKYINSLAKGGYGMDAQWIDEFHHALRVTSGQQPTGYYSDFNGIEHLAKSYRDAYVYDGQYSFHREKTFGIKTNGNEGHQFIVFSQNHDQIGNRMLGERTSSLVSFNMLKLMSAAVFLSPFLPMIFMGEEWGETNPFQFFISHSNKDLIEAVRKGRKSEFAAFHTTDEVPDPQHEETFNQSKLDWEKLHKEPHANLYQYYRALISLRKQNKALYDLNRENVDAYAFSEQNCLILKRWKKDQSVTCIMNFSNAVQSLEVNLERDSTLLFDSCSIEWGGDDIAQSVANPNHVSISPESILIFLSENV